VLVKLNPIGTPLSKQPIVKVALVYIPKIAKTYIATAPKGGSTYSIVVKRFSVVDLWLSFVQSDLGLS
jgi:hypothetical protein